MVPEHPPYQYVRLTNIFCVRIGGPRRANCYMSATESNKDRPIRVLTSSHDVELFVPEVRRHADTDKDALGFFPGSVYDEAAQSQNLLIAVVSGEGLNMYTLAYGNFPPNNRCPASRRRFRCVCYEMRTERADGSSGSYCHLLRHGSRNPPGISFGASRSQ